MAHSEIIHVLRMAVLYGIRPRMSTTAKMKVEELLPGRLKTSEGVHLREGNAVGIYRNRNLLRVGLPFGVVNGEFGFVEADDAILPLIERSEVRIPFEGEELTTAIPKFDDGRVKSIVVHGSDAKRNNCTGMENA